MITDDDKSFLANLENIAAKAAAKKARLEAAAAQAEGEAPEEGAQVPINVESGEEVDEITLLLVREEKENAERAIQEEATKKQ